MCALLLQGSGFCVLSEALPAVVSVALSSTDAGFKYSYCRVSALTQPVDQTILVSRTDYAFLIKQFQAPQSAGVVNASKLRFIRQFVMAVKKRQSTQILLRCPFDEKMSFIVQLRFGLKVPGAKKASTDVTIYGLWPTIPQQIFEFVKTSVEQKTVWSITQKVVAVGAACGGALGVGAVVNNVRDARLQREKKAAQDLEDEKEWHKTNCRSGYCQRYYGILCDGHGETDPVVAAQNKKARETAKNEQNHRDRCQNNLCYRFGELTCDGWGELNRELWAQKAQEREAAAAQERENDRIRRIANEANHRDFCRNRYCGRYGNFECDGYGETNRDFWAERAEQRRLAEVARLEQERVAAEAEAERVAAQERDREKAAIHLMLFLKEFKTFLTKTTFINFIVGEKPNEEDGLPNFAAMRGPRARMLPLAVKNLCPHYYESIIDGKNIELTGEQLEAFFGGTFKESTIDLLAQFQANYFVALSQETSSDTDVNLKAAALIEFKQQINRLADTDPVEAKRILCFHPRLIWNKLTEKVMGDYTNPFYDNFTKSPAYHLWQTIDARTSNDPQRLWRSSYVTFPGAVGYDLVKANFCTILNHALTDTDDPNAYCLTHYFPRDIALFENLHSVKCDE